jgi:hypothetical protein
MGLGTVCLSCQEGRHSDCTSPSLVEGGFDSLCGCLDADHPSPEVKPPQFLALCMECMNWWNAGSGRKASELKCPDDNGQRHRVALYLLQLPDPLR